MHARPRQGGLRGAQRGVMGGQGGPGGARGGQGAQGASRTLLSWSRNRPVPVPGQVVGATVFRAAGGGRASWVDLRHRGRGA